jgi:hypothetical protein
LLQEIIKPTNNQYTINIPDNYINQDIKFIMFPLVDDLDIEPIYPDDPDYQLIQEVKNEDTISLDEFMNL